MFSSLIVYFGVLLKRVLILQTDALITMSNYLLLYRTIFPFIIKYDVRMYESKGNVAKSCDEANSSIICLDKTAVVFVFLSHIGLVDEFCY